LTLLLLPLALAAGWSTWTRLPPGRGDGDDALESAFATLLCGVFVTGWLALLLAEIGALRPLPLAAGLLAISLVLAALPRRSGRGIRPRRWHLAAAAFVTVLAIAAVAPASEDLLGGRDGGTYANTAVWLAREGTVQVRSDALAGTPGEWRRIFHASTLLPGFYIEHAASGSIVPQFLHLHPSFMALGYWVAGLPGLFLVPPLFGILSVLAVYFFVRRTLGAAAAAIAASVLALNLAQIWGARNPYSEVPTQLGIAAALWAIAAAHGTGGVRWGILGGAALGTCFLLRIDAPLLLLIVLPALVVLAAVRTDRPRWITHGFLPVASGLALWGIAHAWYFSRPYVTDLARLVRPLWVLTALVVIGCAVALALPARVRRPIEFLHRRGVRIWLLAAIAVCAAFAFGMWVRPQLEPFVVRPQSGVRTYVEETLVRVGWYFSQPGMILALAGVVLVLRRWLVERRAEWLPFLALLLGIGTLYFWNQRIYPDHPWMMRRFLPVVVPGISIAIAAAVTALWAARGRWRVPARIAGAAAVAFVLAHEVMMAAPFWSLREKDGLIAQIEALAGHIPDGSLVLYDRPGPDAGVAAPLAMAWDRPVLPVIRLPNDPGGERRRARFEAQVLRWVHDGRDVLYLTANDGDAVFLAREVRWQEAATLRIDVPTFGVRYDGPPREPQRYTADFRLLRAVPAADDPLPCAGSALHAGGRLGNVMQGLYGLEATPRERFHWASPRARVVFPACRRSDADRPARLRVRASCGREPSEGTCNVGVAVNGEPAGELALSQDFADHDLPLPPHAVAGEVGAIEVRFSGPEFIPGPTGARQPRVLSFQLSGVSLH